MEDYSKRPLCCIERTNFLPLSCKIRATEDHENVLNISATFLSAGMLKGIRFTTDPDSEEGIEQFKSFLLKDIRALSILLSVVETDIMQLGKEDTVFICSPEEMKLKYMTTLSSAIYQLFGYQMYRYPEEAVYDIEDVIKRILYYRRSIQEHVIRYEPRKRYGVLNEMERGELKRLAKKHGVYYKGMRRQEIIDAIMSEYESR